MPPHYGGDRQQRYGGCSVQIYARLPRGSVPRIEASDDLRRAVPHRPDSEQSRGFMQGAR
jgi:hypothetical protein